MTDTLKKRKQRKIENILNNPVIDRIMEDLGDELIRTYGKNKTIKDYFTDSKIRREYADVKKMAEVLMMLQGDKDNYVYDAIKKEDIPQIIRNENIMLAKDAHNIFCYIMEFYGNVNVKKEQERIRKQRRDQIRKEQYEKDTIAKKALDSLMANGSERYKKQ